MVCIFLILWCVTNQTQLSLPRKLEVSDFGLRGVHDIAYSAYLVNLKYVSDFGKLLLGDADALEPLSPVVSLHQGS
jgi:hypothetical protein